MFARHLLNGQPRPAGAEIGNPLCQPRNSSKEIISKPETCNICQKVPIHVGVERVAPPPTPSLPRQGGSTYYGTHPSHWYVSAALPAVLGTHLPLVLRGVLNELRRDFSPGSYALTSKNCNDFADALCAVREPNVEMHFSLRAAMHFSLRAAWSDAPDQAAC